MLLAAGYYDRIAGIVAAVILGWLFARNPLIANPSLPVVGWMLIAHAEGKSVAQAHLRHLNPLPANLGDVLKRHKTVLCPEMNMGQLRMMLRARYLVDIIGLNKVQGMPFRIREILSAIEEHTS